MIKNIVFDLGGVLIDLDIEASKKAFRDLGYAEIDQTLDPYLQSGILLELEEGKASRQDYYDYINSRIAEPVSGGRIDAAMQSFITGITDYKLPMLRELKKDYRVYMLSNTNPLVFDYVRNDMFSVEGLTIDDYFDDLFLSYEMKLVKPYEPIFREMTRRADFRPEETLFIDDAAANVETAAKLGFKTYQPSPGEDYRHIFKEL